jgi:hypothetical protein
MFSDIFIDLFLWWNDGYPVHIFTCHLKKVTMFSDTFIDLFL